MSVATTEEIENLPNRPEVLLIGMFALNIFFFRKIGINSQF